MFDYLILAEVSPNLLCPQNPVTAIVRGGHVSLMTFCMPIMAEDFGHIVSALAAAVRKHPHHQPVLVVTDRNQGVLMANRLRGMLALAGTESVHIALRVRPRRLSDCELRPLMVADGTSRLLQDPQFSSELPAQTGIGRCNLLAFPGGYPAKGDLGVFSSWRRNQLEEAVSTHETDMLVIIVPKGAEEHECAAVRDELTQAHGLPVILIEVDRDGQGHLHFTTIG